MISVLSRAALLLAFVICIPAEFTSEEAESVQNFQRYRNDPSVSAPSFGRLRRFKNRHDLSKKSEYESVESGYESVKSGYESVKSGYKSVKSGHKFVRKLTTQVPEILRFSNRTTKWKRSVYWGRDNATDKVMFEKVVEVPANPTTYIFRRIRLVQKGYRITRIEVLNTLREIPSAGNARVFKGGVGQHGVVIYLRAPRGRHLKYHILITGHPAR